VGTHLLDSHRALTAVQRWFLRLLLEGAGAARSPCGGRSVIAGSARARIRRGRLPDRGWLRYHLIAEWVRLMGSPRGPLKWG